VLRDYQVKLLKMMLDAVRSGQNVFLNSPTGSGKTIMALNLAKRMIEEGIARKILYFVRTHNEYLPILRDVKKFNLDLKVIGLIGKSRLCDNPLKWLLEELEGRVDICKACPKRGMYYPVNYDELIKAESLYKYLKTIPKDYCKYYTLVKAIQESDLVLATYPYLVGYPRKLIDNIAEFDFMIIDEAHNLDKLNEFMSVTLSLRDLEILKNNGYSVDDYIEFHKSRYDARKDIMFIDKSEFRSHVNLFDQELLELYEDALDGKLDGKVDLAKAVIRLFRFVEHLDYGYLELFLTKRSFKLLIVDVGSLISQSITMQSLLMSGTLPPEDYINKIWGLEGKYIDAEKMFNLFQANRKYLYDPTVNFNYKFRDKYIPVAKRNLRILLRSLPKLVLVVFPSYDVIEQFRDIANEFGALVETEKTKLEDVISQVMNGKQIIFAVAGGKLIEGIEIVKDNQSMIKSIVLVGVPYPVPNDYTKKVAERIAMKLGTINVFHYAVHVPALIQIKQAVGRGIRFPHDKNIIVLMDQRFRFFFNDLNIKEIYKIKY